MIRLVALMIYELELRPIWLNHSTGNLTNRTFHQTKFYFVRLECFLGPPKETGSSGIRDFEGPVRYKCPR